MTVSIVQCAPLFAFRRVQQLLLIQPYPCIEVQRTKTGFLAKASVAGRVCLRGV
jgi:hypothetical protein